MSYNIKDNKCEICGIQSIAGIPETKDSTKIHYSCFDHYFKIFNKIKNL